MSALLPAPLAVDPLFVHGIDWTVFLIVIVKTIVVFALLLVAVMFYIWFLRKVIADMQNRIGPNNAGKFGILQTLADGIKLFFKEQSIPDGAERPVFRLAPYLALVPAFVAFSIVPIGGVVTIAGHRTFVQLVDVPIGILVLLAMSGIGLYGVMLAGWSSGSKYPLLGSVRASAQLLSYEAAFGLSILAVLIQSGTLSTRAIVQHQVWSGGVVSGAQWHGWSTLGQWFVVATPIAFVIFVVSAIAETNHPPFDLVEAEQELVGGFLTEYTGIRFAIFFLAEFMNVITMSAIAITLFLGGPAGPGLGFLASNGWVNAWVVPVFWFMLKLLILLFGTVWIRASVPRLRYDQLMNFGWKYLIELAFLWLMVTAVIRVADDQRWDFVNGNRGLTIFVVTVAAGVGAALVYGVLMLCIPRDDELASIQEWD